MSRYAEVVPIVHFRVFTSMVIMMHVRTSAFVITKGDRGEVKFENHCAKIFYKM